MAQAEWSPRSACLGGALGVAVLVAAAVLGGCASASSSGSGAARPTTPARLRIVAPAPGAVVGSHPTLRLQLSQARLASAATSGANLPTDEGFVHVFVDDKLVSILYGLTQKLPVLEAGAHSVRVEFVATDHAPFANRVVAATQFTVKP